MAFLAIESWLMCDNRLFRLVALGSLSDLETSLFNGLDPDYKENDELSALMIASCRATFI